MRERLASEKCLHEVLVVDFALYVFNMGVSTQCPSG